MPAKYIRSKFIINHQLSGKCADGHIHLLLSHSKMYVSAHSDTFALLPLICVCPPAIAHKRPAVHAGRPFLMLVWRTTLKCVHLCSRYLLLHIDVTTNPPLLNVFISKCTLKPNSKRFLILILRRITHVFYRLTLFSFYCPFHC
jgi:hypothetical protein